MVVRNTTRDSTHCDLNIRSHDIGDWTFLGFKPSGFDEAEFAKIGVLWQSYCRYYGCHVIHSEVSGVQEYRCHYAGASQEQETDPGRPHQD
jgi:hypothetical protein